MRLILDPAEDAAHGDWLRARPGGYEWWYFDALSDDREWALTCIWFLGNPFSPYYRLAALGRNADPFAHSALFFALYRHGALYAYHFTRFASDMICADDIRPACLRFGPNELSYSDGCYTLHLADENANRRVLKARLRFEASPLQQQSASIDSGQDDHCWLPAAPACRVEAQITLNERLNIGTETIVFRGNGYHDHNWGTLPFARNIRDWYWARVAVGTDGALIVYHVRRRDGPSVSHLLHFVKGRLLYHDAAARVTRRRSCVNAFGTIYAGRLEVQSSDIHAWFSLGSRLDSAPFYIRTLCDAEMRLGGQERHGWGLGEYFRPKILSWPVVASAMKARLVERL